MKTWKIIKNESEIDKVGLILNEYAKSLSESTSDVLKGYYTIDIIDNRISHVFKITDEKKIHVKIFEIKKINLDGLLQLTVNYYNNSEIVDTNERHLEYTIDIIIQSERMSNYIGHLIRCSKIETK